MQGAVLGQSAMVICGVYMCQLVELREALQRLDILSHGTLSCTDSFRIVLDAAALIKGLRIKHCNNDNEGITRGYSSTTVLQCTDPRDHVFALHGMHPKSDTSLRLVDYGRSVASVFTIAAHRVIQQRGFHAMSMEHADVSREEGDPPLVPGLPSWVPEWSMKGTPRYYPWWMYSAGGTTSDQCEVDTFTNHGTTLHLTGLATDTVSSRWSVPELNPYLRNLVTFAKVEEKLFPQTTYGSSAARLLAIQRTICIGLAYNYDMETTTGYIWSRWSERPGFTDIAKRCFEGTLDPSDNDYSTYVDPKDTDMVLVFGHGHIGLGREHVQPGDVAVIFPGVSIPFILRKRSDGTAYQVISPAYLDGMMNGEAIQASDKHDWSELSFEID